MPKIPEVGSRDNSFFNNEKASDDDDDYLSAMTIVHLGMLRIRIR